jgi:subtilisin family serine protease
MPSVPTLGRRVAASLAIGLLPALLAVPAAAAQTVPAPGGVVAGADSPDAIPGRYVVTLKHGVTGLGASAQSLVAGKVTGGATSSAFVASLNAQEARRLAADPSVAIVEQDRVVRVEATQRNPVWGLDRIDQRGTKASRSYTPMDDGSSVHAYIIDTGIRIANKQFGGRAAYGWDFADDDRYADDCDGHGTHVAGTVGGATYGVAKRVKLVAVRVLDCNGEGALSDVVDGINWVTDNAVKPAVANMSLGSGYSASLEYAVQQGIDSGVTYVVAAGNSNANAYYFSPAGLPAAITVAASDAEDKRAWFSNWGSSVDLFAPGVNIKSAYKGGATATAVLSGTSMAAPHVTGAAALVLDALPSYTPRQVRDYLVARATTGKISDRRNAPNKLLFVPGPPAAPQIKTTSLPVGQAGQAYSAQLTLTSGRRGSWSVAAGTLPDGLTLSTSGLLSGTPAAATATRKIAIRFSDYVPQTATRTFYLLVRA